jgi:hypothetical protein
VADERRAMTPNEYARLIGCGYASVRHWITTGELGAINTAKNLKGGLPRYKILPRHQEAFEMNRQKVAPLPPTPRRRKFKEPEVVPFF